ncbi:transcription regulator hth gntr [Lucifera butyrica]|uniref:Transcription regulator hth gntr n=1 Tax=Lucifera butyrica TaxID=1351585 RepID=A0A498R428_9FIRM|nr:PLP-dependent aminotransferase family protein [Lucifera butyrica]VBB05909.1 transcription regulator hth gntr [Lucifera butyrica]
METFYQQIAAELECNIRDGYYKNTRKLPSVRELCARYGCSKSTVIKAFDTLKSKHIVYSVPQSGYYLVENCLRRMEESTGVIDFSTGNPVIGDAYLPDLKHCLDRAVDIGQNYSLSRHLHGTESLRNLLPNYLADFQVFTSVPNIFINLGVQQALSILTRMPFPNGRDRILVEQPTYRFFIEFLKYHGAGILGIARDEKGIDLDRLESLFKTANIKFFYTVPRNHNPLGTAYSAGQRKAIARLAARYDVYIVEDDYFGDVVTDVRYDPIYAYGDHYHHIYLKSFSKIMPWFRIGIMVVPTHLTELFAEHIWFSYFSSYFSASLVSQATLDIYIRSNILKKQAASIKKELDGRLKCLQPELRRLQKNGVRYVGGQCGFYSYLKLPGNLDEQQLIHELGRQNVLVTPGRFYYAEDAAYEKGIRLSIARTDAARIKKGLSIINETLENMGRGRV